jgi:hypothetical protein
MPEYPAGSSPAPHREHAVTLALGGSLFGTGVIGVISLLVWAGISTAKQPVFTLPWFSLIFALLVVMAIAGAYVMATPYLGWRMPRLRTPEEAIRPRQLMWKFLRWLTRSPYQSMAGDIRALRAEVEALKTERPTEKAARDTPAEPVAIVPELSVDGTKSSVRIAVQNPGPFDSFFEGEIWHIDGTTGSFKYPLYVEWEGVHGSAVLIPAYDMRHLVVADTFHDATDASWQVRFRDPWGKVSARVGIGHEFQLTVAIKVKQEITDGRGFAHIKARILVREFFDPDSEPEEGYYLLAEPTK